MVVKSCKFRCGDSRVFSCGRIYFGPDNSGWRCLMVHMEVIHFFQISHLFTPLYPKKPPVTAEVVTTWRWCHHLFFGEPPVEFPFFKQRQAQNINKSLLALGDARGPQKNGEKKGELDSKTSFKTSMLCPFGYNPHRIHWDDCIFTYMKTHKNQPFMEVGKYIIPGSFRNEYPPENDH